MPEESTNLNDTPNIYSSDDFYNARPELSPAPVDKRPILIAGVVFLVLLLSALGCGALLFSNPVQTAIIRDIFIIYIGLAISVLIFVLIILTVVLTYLVLKTNDLLQLLNREIKPMLFNIQDSIHTVKGTTSFINERAVAPVISTVSAAAGIQAVIRSLFKR